LGRHYGRPYLDKRKGKWIKTGNEKSEALFNAWGRWAVVIARFMPRARVFVPVVAGIAKMNYYKFFSANLVGALAWGTGLTLAGYYSASIPAVKSASYLIAGFFITASLIAGLRIWLLNRRTS
jgi:membrane-associated protein